MLVDKLQFTGGYVDNGKAYGLNGDLAGFDVRHSRILLYLCEHIDLVCTREELGVAGWGASVAVTSESISQIITALRRFVDGPGRSRAGVRADSYIQTIHGVGYTLSRQPRRARAHLQPKNELPSTSTKLESTTTANSRQASHGGSQPETSDMAITAPQYPQQTSAEWLANKLRADLDLSVLLPPHHLGDRSMQEVRKRTCLVTGVHDWESATADATDRLRVRAFCGQPDIASLSVLESAGHPISVDCATNAVAANVVLRRLSSDRGVTFLVDFEGAVGRDQMSALRARPVDVLITGNAAFNFASPDGRKEYVRRLLLHEERDYLLAATPHGHIRKLLYPVEGAPHELVRLHDRGEVGLGTFAKGAECESILPAALMHRDLDMDPSLAYLVWEPLALGLERTTLLRRTGPAVGFHFVWLYSRREFMHLEGGRIEDAFLNAFVAQWQWLRSEPYSRHVELALRMGVSYLNAFALSSGIRRLR